MSTKKKKSSNSRKFKDFSRHFGKIKYNEHKKKNSNQTMTKHFSRHFGEIKYNEHKNKEF